MSLEYSFFKTSINTILVITLKLLTVKIVITLKLLSDNYRIIHAFIRYLLSLELAVCFFLDLN